MKIEVLPGRYVVAVSGGVDSMALLHALSLLDDLELVVAHFEHGIRPDSDEDRKLVQEVAGKYGMTFEYGEGKLGSRASEAAARMARYDFLERVRQKYGAKAIITAHHQDDLLETAILNLLRGTNRKGLSSLANQSGRIRPLLRTSKAEILKYAVANKLQWREDSTNADDTYLRNYIRHHLLPRFSATARARLLDLLEGARGTNKALDAELHALVADMTNGAALDRRLFGVLPHDVAREVLAAWLRQQGIADFDRQTLERIVVAAKTKGPGARIDVLHGSSLLLTQDGLALEPRER